MYIRWFTPPPTIPVQRSIIPCSSGMRYPVNPGATDSGRGASSDEHATRGRTPGTRVKNQCFTKRHARSRLSPLSDGDARAGLPRAGSPAGMRGNRNVKGNDDRHELLV